MKLRRQWRLLADTSKKLSQSVLGNAGVKNYAEAKNGAMPVVSELDSSSKKAEEAGEPPQVVKPLALTVALASSNLPISLNTADAASEAPQFEFYLRHEMADRLRFFVPQTYANTELSRALAVRSMQIQGVTSSRVNDWCGALIVDFNLSIISKRELTEALEKIPCVELDERKEVQPVVVPRYSQWQMSIIRSINFLEKQCPPLFQLVVGGAGLIAALSGLPLLFTRAILTVSIVPVVVRAAKTLLEDRKVGVDALDASAAGIMLASGRVTEACFMTLLISMGEFIREKTAQKCRKIVDDLLGLSGQNAWLVKGRRRISIAADKVEIGDVVVVYPGELIPVDGYVQAGQASIDQSKLTGESMPVQVAEGSRVYAATVLLEGKIYVRCEEVGIMTRAGAALESMKKAPLHETKIQNYASVMADRLVVPIMIAAFVSFVFTRSVIRLMTMLIFDFSTGIRIAAPTAVLSSMHRAGRKGILIKNGGALERLARVDAIIFDKTGTLTSGEPRISRIVCLNGYSNNEIMSYAASVEQRMHHPASRAIIKWASQNNLAVTERSDSQTLRGMGVKAKVGDALVLVGSKRLMDSELINTNAVAALEKEFTENYESIAYVAINNQLSALIGYKDQLRSEAARAISELRRLGIKKLVMATGDSEQVAAQIARASGINEVVSRAFPEQKAELVRQLKIQGHTVAVIGDGINDSPALAHADVALSLHGGTDAAQHGADIVLTDGDLKRLPEAIKIARNAIDLVKQNLSLVLLPNSVGLAMAAIGAVGPAGATLLNNGSAIAGAMNSLRPLYSENWSSLES